MRYIVLIAITLILSYSIIPILAQEPFESSDIEQFSRSVVLILVEKTNGTSTQGSGVIVSPEGIIFTAAHVVEDAIEIKIAVYDGEGRPPRQAYTGQIQRVSETLDFAIIEIFADQQGQPLDPTALNLSYIPTWSVASMTLTERVFIWGYPSIGSGMLSSMEGSISVTRQSNGLAIYESDAVFATGASGGLVINSAGEFIGIPVDFRVDGPSTGQFTTIIPISTICESEPSACIYMPAPPDPTSTQSTTSRDEVSPVLVNDCEWTRWEQQPDQSYLWVGLPPGTPGCPHVGQAGNILQRLLNGENLTLVVEVGDTPLGLNICRGQFTATTVTQGYNCVPENPQQWHIVSGTLVVTGSDGFTVGIRE